MGGDITTGDGRGGAASTRVASGGPSFRKEMSPYRHARGSLSMIADEEEVKSQFYISLGGHWERGRLNKDMVVFGKVLESGFRV